MNNDKSPIRKLVDQLVSDLTEDIAGERVLKYIVKELHKGRKLPSVLEDPYVKNRVSDERAQSLIGEPDIIIAVEDSLKATFKHEEL